MSTEQQAPPWEQEPPPEEYHPGSQSQHQSPTQHSPSEAEEEAERNVLGSILLSGGQALDYLDLNPGDYRAPLHEDIHRAAASLRAQGKPADQVTVSAALTRAGVRCQPAYLHQLAEATVSPAVAEHYAHIVAEGASRRRADQAAMVIRQMVAEYADPQAIQEAAQKAFDGITPASRSDAVRFTAETLDDSLVELESEPVTIPTPWDGLNRMIGGLRPGALYTVGARPGVGKSVVAVRLAVELAKRGAVPFISLEMSTADLHHRMIAAAAQVSIGAMESRQLNDHDWERIAGVADQLKALPLAILDRASVSIGDIRRYVTAASRRGELGGVIIDYLQLIAPPPGDRRKREEFISDLTRELKVLAMELNVPVILLAQLNRESTKRESKLPEISDLRGSGAIEQDSDVVILLHRLPDDIAEAHHIWFRVAKNRRGKPGSVCLNFKGHYADITD